MKIPKNYPHQPAHMKESIRVLVVDDHPIVREGLEHLLSRENDMEVCGFASNANEALSNINETKPDFMIVDIGLEDGINGIELLKMIRKQHPQIKTLVLSMYDEKLYAERAVQAGARGYLMKEDFIDTIVTAIRQIMNGHLYLSNNIVSKVVDNFLSDQSGDGRAGIEKLTNRELEVLQLIGRGFKTLEIAKNLNISVKTVGTYRSRIQTKLNIENNAGLVKFAIDWVHNN